MPSTVQPVIVSRDLERLAGFYRSLLGAVETERVPAEGPTFFVGLRIGDSDLGVVSDGDVPDGPQRMLLSVEVPDVDALLPRVTELGGRVSGPANDMPWGQRVAHVQDPDGNTVNLTQQL
ncbi:VOC family protein [Modestobacter versicolor]|uniref:Extradiol dioxygenase n=1 Tax=Modestobacter versicolor TaxID=429133 RepID=A0A323VE05_9ACTN|nr:VOC family protein [Modestobacter versicolor]MBB3675277.1 putative enzyme related to lactoylglutathione lyase [Modestobacter versicolor]PZA21506.1 extradiol dioxygenase [Modestobacter versicolor]